MTDRVDTYLASPQAMQAMMALELSVARLGLEPALLQLVKLRASQLNRCAFCIDRETAEALHAGENARRLSALPAWRDYSNLFSERERAALGWTEAMTLLTNTAAADDMFQPLGNCFSEKQIIDLTLAIVAINSWNRMGVGFRRKLF